MSNVADTMFGEIKRTLFSGEWAIVILSAIGFVAVMFAGVAQ